LLAVARVVQGRVAHDELIEPGDRDVVHGLHRPDHRRRRLRPPPAPLLLAHQAGQKQHDRHDGERRPGHDDAAGGQRPLGGGAGRGRRGGRGGGGGGGVFFPPPPPRGGGGGGGGGGGAFRGIPPHPRPLSPEGRRESGGRPDLRRLHLGGRPVEVPFLARLPETEEDRGHDERENAAGDVGHGV